LKRTNPEDFTIIYPEFKTDFLLEIPSKNIDKQGTFDIFYRYEEINALNYYGSNPYAAYLYGDVPLLAIKNYLANDGKRILVIKDSFVNVVNPFLSLGVENLEALDIRYFTGSLKTYIERNKPDIVIVMYSPGSLNNRQAFDFR
jgi:LmbE family N-acetylglucosaminyl deacetylase